MRSKKANNHGFVDSIVRDMEFINIADACKDSSGKVDPYKAAAMARGMGYTSNDDMDALGVILGSKGAFGELSGSEERSNKVESGDIYFNFPGKAPIQIYDASKDSWGIMMLKFILVIVLCVGAFVLIFKHNPSDLGKIACLFGAAAISFLILKNTW